MYQYEKYACTTETALETLRKYGVAIVPNVLSADECTAIVSGMWDFFEHLTSGWERPVRRDTPESWVGLFNLFPNHGMLWQHYACGNSQVAWDVRQNPKVVNVFARLWNAKIEDMLVSFDGISFAVPSEVTQRGWFHKTWFHTDQSFTRNNFECVQGWVTGLDVGEGDATLAFYEGSHQYHAELAQRFEIHDTSDWYKLTNEQELFLAERCTAHRIACPKGSIVLWDSRTIHCGAGPIRGRIQPNYRAVVYVCYQPRAHATEKDLAKKRKVFEQQRMTSHWAIKSKMFGKAPRTYGKSLPLVTPISPPVLTELGRRLAGY